MDSKTSNNLGRLSYVVLGVWIVNTVLIGLLILRIDSIVHVQLYGYGLQFSHNWADPYWASLNLIYVFMGVPMILSAVLIGIVLTRNRKYTGKFFANLKIKSPKAIVKETKPLREIATIEKDALAKSASTEPKLQAAHAPYEPKLEVINEGRTKENNGLLISCPSCNKVFNRPLVMLDFSSGKTQLVNICPYCNHTLGQASDHNKDDRTTNIPSAASK